MITILNNCFASDLNGMEVKN